jgi:hypothetical protein
MLRFEIFTDASNPENVFLLNISQFLNFSFMVIRIFIKDNPQNEDKQKTKNNTSEKYN